MPVSHDGSLLETINASFATIPEKIGAVVSVGMISTPLWLQQLKPFSDAAAMFAPILGCVYLSLQIGFKLLDRTRDGE